MAIPPPHLPLLLIFSLLLPPSFSQTCTSDTFSSVNKPYSLCSPLPQLSSTLHWTYHPSNSTVDVAYRAPQSADGWIAWALNPTGTGMDGAQTLFAFHNSDGAMTAVSSPITLSNPVVKNSSLSFKIYTLAAEFSGNTMTIYATIELPHNRTRVNHVWQASKSFSSGLPSGHPTTGPNVQSTATLDLNSGQSAAAGNSRLSRKNTHGVLNAVSWGFLMPVGAIIARYMRVFESADPAWFYLHVACQCSAYAVGVAGWGTGLKLGGESKGITYHSHRIIGIALFSIATLQVFALLLRPKKDHKFRIYWNVYHHGIGYAVIILSVINIFKGFDILNPDNNWKHAYIAIIAALGGIAVILEVITWGVVLKRKSSVRSEKPYHGANGMHGTGGHGGRQNQTV